MRYTVALLCSIGWIWGAKSNMFDAVVKGVLISGMFRLVQRGSHSMVFVLALLGGGALVGVRVGMLLLSEELVYVGYLPGRELLIIQLPEDVLAPLHRISVGCLVYLHVVWVVPYGVAVPCQEVGRGQYCVQ